MPTRLPATARHLAFILALIAGTTLSAASLADDGGAAGMDKAAPKAAAARQPGTPRAVPATAAKDAKEQQAKDAEMLKDFVHYVKIDHAELAKTMGQGLIDRNFSPVEFASLVDTASGYKRFSEAVSQAGRQAALESIAGQLLKLYESGKLAAARDPEAIAASIKLLGGDMRQRAFARDRLLEAGEYAVPQLFNAFVGGADIRLSAEIRRLLIELGRHSVMPLVAALPKLNSTQQEQVIGVLGETRRTQSLPFLYDLAASTTSDAVRSAAESAIGRISGAVNAQMPLAERYNDLADQYLGGSPSLIAFPNDAHQLVWNYEPATGLTFQAVDSKVYGQTMAMRVSEAALRHDAASSRGVSTWVMSNFSREIRSPEGYENPVYPAGGRDAMYYGVAAGPSIGQSVLGRSLDMGDTPLVRRALAALEKTGGRDLWQAAANATRRPLLEGLRYPNRRVQYEAALAIGSAQPKDAFPGSESVVRTLASSIRDASAKYALVVAPNAERAQGPSDVLRRQGFTLLPPAQTLDDVRQAVADSPGVDLIVSAELPSQQTGELIVQALSDPRLRATPILAIVSAQGYLDLNPRYARDVRVRLIREGAGAAAVEQSSVDLIDKASGGLISGDEADSYKARSLAVLRDLAVSGSAVLNVAEAQGPLVTASTDAKGDTKARIVEILSLIASKESQVALADAALTAEPELRTRLLGYLAGSAKRFGNMLAQHQVDSLVELAGSASGEEATAAAAVVGSLNLQGSGVVPMILGAKK